jgi:hypothetical protein
MTAAFEEALKRLNVADREAPPPEEYRDRSSKEVSIARATRGRSTAAAFPAHIASERRAV